MFGNDARDTRPGTESACWLSSSCWLRPRRSPPAPMTGWSMSAPCRNSKARCRDRRSATLPRNSISYRVPTVVAITTAATRKLLAANGWQEFAYPDPRGHPMSFKKGQQGLTVSFTQGLGRPDQSVVYYSADRIYNNVPFPQDATDIVFDHGGPI